MGVKVMQATQLLCTFTTVDRLDATLRQIVRSYDVAFDTIYILQNVDLDSALCCTYNINVDKPVQQPIPEATISLHRKKATNTLYTINALNMLVAELNDGKIDAKFQLPWEELRNTIIVTAYNQLKKINTKLHKIIKVSELLKD
jgi:hypothetical protein